MLQSNDKSQLLFSSKHKIVKYLLQNILSYNTLFIIHENSLIFFTYSEPKDSNNKVSVVNSKIHHSRIIIHCVLTVLEKIFCLQELDSIF